MVQVYLSRIMIVASSNQSKSGRSSEVHVVVNFINVSRISSAWR